jgi:creatinine amidohydrolase
MEEMRPAAVAACAQAGQPAFVPVSPCLEWHSYHLPLGVDGLIAEAVAARLASLCAGVHCRCLSLGLDEIRKRDFKQQQGLPLESEIYGMNFPDLPVGSEYVEPALLSGAVQARLTMLQRCGFQACFIINHHGGRGQRETLETVARQAASDGFIVTVFQVQRFDKRDLPETERRMLSVGGHAGLAETLQLMAFRPELVDLAELPDGELEVRTTGILHSQPRIPPEANPHRAVLAVAQRWGRAVVAAMHEEVTRTMQTHRAGP